MYTPRISTLWNMVLRLFFVDIRPFSFMLFHLYIIVGPRYTFTMNAADRYPHQTVEEKWRGIWEKANLDVADITCAKKPFYNLMMFPYPSAEGLHVGNMYAFTGSDIYGRFKRMQGMDVLLLPGVDHAGILFEGTLNKSFEKEGL